MLSTVLPYLAFNFNGCPCCSAVLSACPITLACHTMLSISQTSSAFLMPCRRVGAPRNPGPEYQAVYLNGENSLFAILQLEKKGEHGSEGVPIEASHQR